MKKTNGLYVAYDKNDNIIACGSAEHLAEVLGLKRKLVYQIASRTRNGKQEVNKTRIYKYD